MKIDVQIVWVALLWRPEEEVNTVVHSWDSPLESRLESSVSGTLKAVFFKSSLPVCERWWRSCIRAPLLYQRFIPTIYSSLNLPTRWMIQSLRQPSRWRTAIFELRKALHAECCSERYNENSVWKLRNVWRELGQNEKSSNIRALGWLGSVINPVLCLVPCLDLCSRRQCLVHFGTFAKISASSWRNYIIYEP